MDKLKFDSTKHKYTKYNKDYISVSKLIAKYKQPFEKEFWALYKSYEEVLSADNFKICKDAFRKKHNHYKYNKDLFKIIELNYKIDQKKLENIKTKVLKIWKKTNKEAIVRGNRIHDQHEEEAYKLGTVRSPFNNDIYEVKKEQNQNEAIVTDLYLLEDGYYPELKLWNDQYSLAGTSDKVYIETFRKKRYVSIDDIKTNKKIKTENYFQKMLAPINHLDDCNHTHYCLQLSLYAWMLEQAGYIVGDLRFTHINRENQEKPYPVTYMKNEVESILRNQK